MEQPDKAMRFNYGKPQLSFIPLNLMEDCARVFEYGANKYARNNWQKGDNLTSLIDSLLRHISKLQEGEYMDEESKLPHLGHIMCNVLFMNNTCKNHTEFVDIKGLLESIMNYELNGTNTVKSKD